MRTSACCCGAGQARPADRGEDRRLARTMNSAKPPRSRLLPRAAAAAARRSPRHGASSSVVNGALRLTGSRPAAGGPASGPAGPRRPPAATRAASRWGAVPASCTSGTGRSVQANDSNPATSCGHEHTAGHPRLTARTRGGPPSAAAPSRRPGYGRRSRQGRRDRTATLQQHRAALRAASPQSGPALRLGATDPVWGESRRVRTTTPPKPHRVHQHPLRSAEPQAEPAQQGPGLGPPRRDLTAPCQVTRTSVA